MMEKNYALVTGGTSGMGLEYVKKLAAMGYNVIIAALPGRVDEDGKPVGVPSPESIAEQLKVHYPELDFVPVGMDLAREKSAEELMVAIKEKCPENAEIEVLVNNAGFIQIKHFREMPVQRIEMEMMLHNLTLTKLCHYILPSMKARGKGYVLNISSLAAYLPYPFITLYSATKAFNRILTKALRIEYAHTGVRIATIYFGAVDTPLYKLSPGKRRLARCLGVMITPEKATRKALKMLFSGRSGWMPGFVNKLALVVCPLLPNRLIAWIDWKVSKALGIEL